MPADQRAGDLAVTAEAEADGPADAGAQRDADHEAGGDGAVDDEPQQHEGPGAHHQPDGRPDGEVPHALPPKHYPRPNGAGTGVA